MIKALLQRGQWYVPCNCLCVLCILIGTRGTSFFPVGKHTVKWQLCLNGNIVICISWSLLSLLNATEDHVSKTDSLYLSELGLSQSFGNRGHIADRSLLVKRPWSISAADVLKSFLYKILFWSTVYFLANLVPVFSEKKKKVNSSWRHSPPFLRISAPWSNSHRIRDTNTEITVLQVTSVALEYLNSSMWHLQGTLIAPSPQTPKVSLENFAGKLKSCKPSYKWRYCHLVSTEFQSACLKYDHRESRHTHA